MTKTDTIGRVVRPRKELSDETRYSLSMARNDLDAAEAKYRWTVLEALAVGSFNEVSKATGLSKDTLQRWKREAGK